MIDFECEIAARIRRNVFISSGQGKPAFLLLSLPSPLIISYYVIGDQYDSMSRLYSMIEFLSGFHFRSNIRYLRGWKIVRRSLFRFLISIR